MPERPEFRCILRAFLCARAARPFIPLPAACFSLALVSSAALSFFVRTAPAQAPPAAVSKAPAIPQPPPAPPASKFVVLLDAAHGGEDLGAQLDSQPEQAFTLALSVRLRSLLAARGFQVVTTRESDLTLDNNRRAEIANRANAQACLSLHATEAGVGVHLFASSVAPAPPSRIPAWKTAQGAWVTRSLALAGVLNSAFLHDDLPVTLGRTDLPTVDSMTCPAIAVEVAPPPAKNGEAKPSLGDPAYQARVAEGLAAALLEWRTEARQP